MVNGRRATDRAGAAEHLGVSEQIIAMHTSPKHRQTSGFPKPLGQHDGRAWYALDDLDTYRDAHATQRAEAAPPGAPEWLRDGDPEELLPATTFRAAAKVTQGTWKRYVQLSRPAWDRGEDGYLPVPDQQEDYRGTGRLYAWRRIRMITWLDNRPGSRATGTVGRPPGQHPTVADARAILATAGPQLSGTRLAELLHVPLPTAYRLLRQAREQQPPAKPEPAP